MRAESLDDLMTRLGIANKDLVSASTEQLTFKMVQKGRRGERLTRKVQEKILAALLTLKPDLKIQLRDLFRYEMDSDKVDQIHQAIALVQQRKIQYPKYVDLLGEAGINKYVVEVAEHRTSFYAAGGEAFIQEGPAVSGTQVRAQLDEDALRQAIDDAQNGRIDYMGFLKAIHNAGVVAYEANMRDRVIRYKGLEKTYKEPIPVN